MCRQVTSGGRASAGETNRHSRDSDVCSGFFIPQISPFLIGIQNRASKGPQNHALLVLVIGTIPRRAEAARVGGGKEIFVCYIQTLSLVQLERAEFGLFIPAKIFEKY